jgi:hypothetical protein
VTPDDEERCGTEASSDRARRAAPRFDVGGGIDEGVLSWLELREARLLSLLMRCTSSQYPHPR